MLPRMSGCMNDMAASARACGVWAACGGGTYMPHGFTVGSTGGSCTVGERRPIAAGDGERLRVAALALRGDVARGDLARGDVGATNASRRSMAPRPSRGERERERSASMRYASISSSWRSCSRSMRCFSFSLRMMCIASATSAAASASVPATLAAALYWTKPAE